MKFRYYIIDLFYNTVTGTNKEKEVFFGDIIPEGYVVIDVEKGIVSDSDGDITVIKDVEDSTVRD